MTEREFTRRVVIARAVLGAAGALASAAIPGEARPYAMAGSVAAVLSSVGFWLILRRSWRATAAAMLAYDAAVITILHASGTIPAVEIGYSWPMIMAAFLLGPRWAVWTALGESVAMLATDLVIGNVELAPNTVIGPFTLLVGIGYVLGTFATLQRRMATDLGSLTLRHREIVENSPNAIVFLDQHFHPLEWNPAAERLFGWDPDRGLGTDVPLGRWDDLDILERARATLESGGSFGPLVTQRTRPDGSALSLSVSMSPIPGAEGGVQGYVASFSDVTLLIRQQEQFRLLSTMATRLASQTDPREVAESFLRAAIRLGSADAAAIVELRGQVCEIASAVGAPDWLVGYRYPSQDTVVAEATDRRTPIVVHDYQTDRRAHFVFRQLGFRSMLYIPLPEGGPIRGALFVARVRWSAPFGPTDVQLIEALAGHAAVAQQRALALEYERGLREELERANRLKDDFLSAVSHELRTPLTALLGFVQTVNERWEDIDAVLRAELLGRAQLQGHRLQRLIERLLDLSRVSGGYRAKLRGVNPRAVAEAAVDALDARSRCRVDVPDVVALAEPDDLELVLRNLVENAMKYGGPGPVDVEGRCQDGRVVLVVADAGPGVPPAERDRLFERFFRGSASSGAPGLGIGLALVREFVEGMHGTVWYEDRAPAGAKFVLSLGLALGEGDPHLGGTAVVGGSR